MSATLLIPPHIGTRPPRPGSGTICPQEHPEGPARTIDAYPLAWPWCLPMALWSVMHRRHPIGTSTQPSALWTPIKSACQRPLPLTPGVQHLKIYIYIYIYI
jgi:hypothetical protein